MYFHILENARRNGVKGYLHTKSYKSFKRMEKALVKAGKPVWVIETELEYLPHIPYHKDFNTPALYGGFTASIWNTGGWQSATLPLLPLL